MSLKLKFENTVDAIREVSYNALSKHGKSRSRQRIFQLSVDLQKTWNLMSSIDNINEGKNIVYHVIKQSANGLKVNSIVKRTGLDKRTTTKLLAEMYVQDKVITPVNISDKKGCYVDTKYKIKK
tara:strand:+ start:41 stop:412 length:372 start_codon:yes stop_codon:yes gene_type:complete